MKLHVLLIALATLSLGCEEDVVSVLGTDKVYTLYGVLNPLADTQYVRVFPIEAALTASQPDPLEVLFESVNLTTGETLVWQDSIVADFGGYGHIFWSPFRAVYGDAYRLSVAGANQQTATVSVAVPPLTEPELEEPFGDRTVLQSVRFQGDIPRLIRTEVSFYTQYKIASSTSSTVGVRADTVVVDYSTRAFQSEGATLLNINLSAAADLAAEQAGGDRDYLFQFGITLLFVELKAIVANEAWNPPEGSFDPFVLVQPGTLSNVENGFGFVGAGYRVERRWQPTNEVMERAGFAPFE